MSDNILEVKHLKKYFPIKGGFFGGVTGNVKAVDDETQIDLDINYEKLYYNMRDAKATWLFKLPSWKKVLPDDKAAEIAREYRDANIAHSEKIGRNDPCPCGSGKKYKKCCGKNA